nr:immunoglobulin heavy chain junction region [Macaca mulatta]MOX64667.1 immunoglobulin heavy chain junction region [Macaca mulatta]MOX64769.1 immunoglobulin heavy chain junction region [Macaca mulatta]MOX65756.1 immunoglobulin heavy chain junction region [Macaca mulatta]
CVRDGYGSGLDAW